MNEKKTQLRWSERLREEIRTAAQVSGRSMNAEILQRLQASLACDDQQQGRAA